MLQMLDPKRIYYTAADKALMWDRWQRLLDVGQVGRSCIEPPSCNRRPAGRQQERRIGISGNLVTAPASRRASASGR
jgi:hypothetical protein